MFIYTYIHNIYIATYTHVHTHTHIPTYIYIHIHTYQHTYIHTYTRTYTYTGCPRRNVPDFGRVFLILNYTDITQNT